MEANRLADGGPIRTCAGCGGRAPQRDLTRIAATSGGAIVFNAKSRAPGRGAYLHPNRNCLDRALKRRAIERALKLKHPAPHAMQAVGEEMARWLEGKCHDG